MRIAYDASPLYHQKTGIGHYTYNLINAIAKQDQNNDVILFSKKMLKKKKNTQISMLNLEGNNIEYSFQPLHNKLFYMSWKTFGFPTTELFTGKVDITHGPNFLPLPTNKSKKVVTIHDSAFIRYPEYVAAKTRMMFTTQVPKIAKEVDAILTVSDHAREEIIELFDVPEEKVHVVYNAAASDNYRVYDINKIDAQKKFANGFPYLLYVGTIEPRKNIINIIKSFNLFKKRTGDSLRLVLSGRKGWLYNEIMEEVNNSKFKDSIIFTDYVKDEDMPLLYNGAEAFIYPSYYEGFGMPVLEAMKCGVPVITSNTSSLPEVIGDAGILVNPNDFESITNEIDRLLSDDILRKNMVNRGLKQAEKFSWENSAKMTLNIYKSLL